VSDATRPIDRSSIEVERLFAIAARDLGQAEMEALHLDTRYALAYNAALQLATVVLRLHGVRVRTQAFHARTFAELKGRLPRDRQHFAEYFDRARRKRNIAAYEQANVASEAEVDDLIERVSAFQAWVKEQVKQGKSE